MPMKPGRWAPHTCQRSACPPVWLRIVIEISIRGPATSPFACASLTPRSEPPASRTVVTPAANVRAIRSAARKKFSENGVTTDDIGSRLPSDMKCTWLSMKPGMIVRPVQSTASSASSPGPTVTIRPSSTTTSAGAGAAPVPSNTDPPVNTVRMDLP